MKIVLILFFLCSACYAEDIILTSNFILKKPNILTTKILSQKEQNQVEDALKEQGRKLIHKELKPVKNDYQNDFDRGTVDYTPKCRNYSFHKVIIPDGTVIQNSNFIQKEPHSQAIEGKNLTFISCNLSNVEIDPTWILNDCNDCQVKEIKLNEVDLGNGNKKIKTSHQVEIPKGSGNYIEVEQNETICMDSDSYNTAILRLNTK